MSRTRSQLREQFAGVESSSSIQSKVSRSRWKSETSLRDVRIKKCNYKFEDLLSTLIVDLFFFAPCVHYLRFSNFWLRNSGDRTRTLYFEYFKKCQWNTKKGTKTRKALKELCRKICFKLMI